MTDAQVTTPRAIMQAHDMLTSMEVMGTDRPDANFAAVYAESDQQTMFALLLFADRAVRMLSEEGEVPAADIRSHLRSCAIAALSLEEINS